MASKRFCDICDAPLTPTDDTPFIREYGYTPPGGNEDTLKAQGALLITNERGHVMMDVCNPCKLNIIVDGTPVASVATLQSGLTPKLFAAPTLPVRPPAPPAEETPPALPPLNLEPSAPQLSGE